MAEWARIRMRGFLEWGDVVSRRWEVKSWKVLNARKLGSREVGKSGSRKVWKSESFNDLENPGGMALCVAPRSAGF